MVLCDALTVLMMGSAIVSVIFVEEGGAGAVCSGGYVRLSTPVRGAADGREGYVGKRKGMCSIY